MKRFEVTWTWQVASPLHVGSGHSRPGFADRLVSVDSQGRPFVPGDAVKGALRLSAEEVAAWLGHDQERGAGGYDAKRTTEPTWEPLALLFGGGANAHFRPGEVSGGSPTAVRAATAIDETGRARDNTLRQVEALMAADSAAIESGVTVWFDDGHHERLVQAAETLLLAALAATESLGAKTGIGWGRVGLAKVKVDRHQTVVVRDLVRAERIDDLRSWTGHLATGWALPPVGRARATPCDTWYRLSLTLDESLTVARRPWVSNHVDTQDHVPATVLRGALRAAWLREGRQPDDISTWLGPEGRWTAAVPVGAVPIPNSFAVAKGDETFGPSAAHGVHDSLCGHKPPDRESDGISPIQWRGTSGWMSIDNRGTIQGKVEPTRETRMHVARNYATRSKRAGALYARDALSPLTRDGKGVELVAFARLPAGVQFPAEILLGKRVSAGSGKATLRADPLDPRASPSSWPRRAANPGDSNVFVQLVSPALVRGKDGHPLRSLAPDEWVDIANGATGLHEPLLHKGDIEPNGENRSLAMTAARRVGGWMKPWLHGRQAAMAIEAGSVWRLRCRNATVATTLRSRLLALEDGGIGENRHEGFGRILVDPAWLGNQCGGTLASNPSPPPPKAGDGPRPWPGCETLAVAELEALAAEAQRLWVSSELRGPLQELARRLREDHADLAQIWDFVKDRTNRTEKSSRGRQDLPRDRRLNQWEGLAKEPNPTAVREFLDRVKNDSQTWGAPARLAAMRFAVEALLVRATGGER